ncbi:maltose/maltodextrin transporter ATP-binding protein [Actinobacillus pleuropneumoniae]|nr:maltose/maltodextrin transporter ATP-binding protein [Actinobacillus pleuropneumoniae]
MNFLPVRVIDVREGGVKIELPDSTHLNFWVPVESGGVKVGDNLSLGIRPEHLLPCEQSEVCISGTVKVVEQLGNETQVHIEMPPIKQSLVYRQNDIVLVKEGDLLIRIVVIFSEKMARHANVYLSSKAYKCS